MSPRNLTLPIVAHGSRKCISCQNLIIKDRNYQKNCRIYYKIHKSSNASHFLTTGLLMYCSHFVFLLPTFFLQRVWFPPDTSLVASCHFLPCWRRQEGRCLSPGIQYPVFISWNPVSCVYLLESRILCLSTWIQYSVFISWNPLSCIYVLDSIILC